MKKLLTIGLAAAMTFAVASQVKAAVPLETSAELRVRAFYVDSFTGAVAANGKTNEWWDQRLRLTTTWPVAEGVKMVVRADIGEGLWGDNAQTTSLAVAEDAKTGVHTVTSTTTGVPAKATIHFDRVYMEFKWPASPITLTLGRQESSWGTGITFKNDDRDRFKITGNFDFGTIIALYQKRAEVFGGHDTNSLDDNRQWGVGYVGKAAGQTFGLVFLQTAFEADPTVDNITYTASVYDIGKVGPVDLSAEAVYTFGKRDYTAASGKTDQDVSGMGLYVGAFMPAGPVTVGVEGAYASGDDPATKGKDEGGFKFDYHSPFWSVVLFNQMDLGAFYESNMGANTSVNNAWAAKLTCVAKPTPALTVVGAVVYGSKLQDVVNADKSVTKAAALGPEFDLIFVYAITPNVNWTVGAGYLIPGDFYTSGGRKADNALAATSQFVLMF